MTPAMKPDDIPEDVWEAATITTRQSIRVSFVDPLMPMIVTMTPYVARAIMAERERALREGSLLGFNESGEGYNGEYPFQDNGRVPDRDPKWIESRDQAIAAAIRQER